VPRATLCGLRVHLVRFVALCVTLDSRFHWSQFEFVNAKEGDTQKGTALHCL
jgi:hypothetical protein